MDKALTLFVMHQPGLFVPQCIAGTHESMAGPSGVLAPVWLKLLLFFASVASWSVSDTLSAYVLRYGTEKVIA